MIGVAAVLAAILSHVLSREDQNGPPHQDVVVGPGIPATFYVPGRVDRSYQQLPDPPPAGHRLPAVVLAHGFSADRITMSSLARSLAAAGYAVVAFDFRGHGANGHGFGSGELIDDVGQAVSWAARSPYVDPHRIAIMGHSMGAGAVLDFATRDPRPAAVVALSGGYVVDGPQRPANALMVWASGDPPYIRKSSRHLASRLAGQPVELDRTYGDVATATAVRATVIGGVNHGTELWSGKTVARVTTWLDQVFNLSRAHGARRVDRRLGTAGWYLLCVLVLVVGVGFLAGKLTPPLAQVPAAGSWSDLGIVAAALTVALPFSGVVSLAGFLSLAAGDAAVGYLALAGGILVALGALGVARSGTHERRGRFPLWPGPWPSGGALWAVALPSLIGFGAIYVLFAPMGVIGHRLVPTPWRLLAQVVATVLLAPLFIAFHSLLRRGRAGAAAARSVLGHVLIVLGLLAGVAVGLLPFVLSLLLPVFIIVFVIIEFFAAGFSARSSNAVVIALVEAALLAGLVAVIMPIG